MTWVYCLCSTTQHSTCNEIFLVTNDLVAQLERTNLEEMEADNTELSSGRYFVTETIMVVVISVRDHTKTTLSESANFRTPWLLSNISNFSPFLPYKFVIVVFRLTPHPPSRTTLFLYGPLSAIWRQTGLWLGCNTKK